MAGVGARTDAVPWLGRQQGETEDWKSRRPEAKNSVGSNGKTKGPLPPRSGDFRGARPPGIPKQAHHRAIERVEKRSFIIESVPVRQAAAVPDPADISESALVTIQGNVENGTRTARVRRKRRAAPSQDRGSCSAGVREESGEVNTSAIIGKNTLVPGTNYPSIFQLIFRSNFNLLWILTTIS